MLNPYSPKTGLKVVVFISLLLLAALLGCADPNYHGYLNDDEPLGYYEVQAAGAPFYNSGPGPGFWGGGGFGGGYYGGPGYYSGMPYGPYGGGWW